MWQSTNADESTLYASPGSCGLTGLDARKRTSKENETELAPSPNVFVIKDCAREKTIAVVREYLPGSHFFPQSNHLCRYRHILRVICGQVEAAAAGGPKQIFRLHVKRVTMTLSSM